jgi:mannitol-1-phosphate/altronate dehydrogenase
MFSRLASALVLRRLTRDVTALADALQAQNALLARLVDRLAPATPAADRTTVRADTGVDHFDSLDGQLAEAYIEKTERDTGHTPDEDEVLIHLQDEKTIDLHTRLVAREGELERLRASRAW